MSYLLNRNPYNTPLSLLRLNNRKLSPRVRLAKRPARLTVAEAYQAPRVNEH